MRHPLLPVILCGGSGTRLWPLSRQTHPKQFLALAGSQTLLEQTATRLRGLTQRIPQAPAPVLVCNAAHRFLAASQLMQAGVEQATIVLEPAGRNTAPALTLAALQADAGSGPDAVLLAMPADHVMADLAAFHRALEPAYEAAGLGAMLAFGVTADRPETGYGYIRCKPSVSHPVGDVEAFIEKPDLESAQRYLAQGDHLWNSGMFMVRASVWLRAMEHCRPDILHACRAAMRDARMDLDFIRPDAVAFAACPSDSIDYAVMERLPAMPQLGIAARVVALQAGWSDIGSWDALWREQPRDSRGNALVGEAMQQDCGNSLLLSSSRLVAGVGLDDVIVVETPDAVLVAGRSSAQKVKDIVAHLAREGHALTHAHRKVHRPWGWYDRIDKGERFQVKRIVVNPGASLSLQMHHHRAEHWVVVRGTAQVTQGDRTFLLGENESTFIPMGHVHRLANPGKLALEIIEIQSGSYLEEDDIVRFDDSYGRVPPSV